jgi:hypothetical protein
MTERIVFVPGWFFSPAACEQVPAIRTALDAFREGHEVEVFRWPCTRGGPDAPPTWAGAAGALREQLDGDCHVVSMGAATAVSLMALDGQGERVGSYVAAGMSTPPATLREAGLDSVAAGAEAMFNWMRSYQYIRLVMQGASEDVWTRTADMMDLDVDWDHTVALQRSMGELNLIARAPKITCPTLYLDSPLNVAGFADVRDIFLRLVPGARVEELEVWPSRLQEKATGLDLTRKALPFIGKGSALSRDQTTG